MKIDNINIKNFRCFDETEISFGTKATVFIGKNGTGKSSIISSLKRGLSFLFAQNRDFSHILSTSSHSNVRQFEFWDARFSEIERVFNYPISIKFNGHFSNKPISWELKKETPKGRVQSTLYKEAQNAILAYYHTNIKNAKLPLLAFYSDSYPHILSNVGSFAKKLVSQDVIPRDFGYYGWDETTNCMELWLIRFNKVSKFIRDYDTDLERTKKQTKQFNENSEGTIAILNKRLEQLKNDKKIIQFRNELSFIENKILKLTEPLDDNLDFINDEFQVDRLLSNNPTEGADDSLEFIFANGSSIFFDMLPQGYKRIFSIAIDLAYRSYILNETNDSEGDRKSVV